MVSVQTLFPACENSYFIKRTESVCGILIIPTKKYTPQQENKKKRTHRDLYGMSAYSLVYYSHLFHLLKTLSWRRPYIHSTLLAGCDARAFDVIVLTAKSSPQAVIAFPLSLLNTLGK